MIPEIDLKASSDSINQVSWISENQQKSKKSHTK